MSASCLMKSTPLSFLGVKLLEFTDRRGLMRCLHPHEEITRASALYFFCPACEKKHGATFMFKLPEIADDAPPVGRYRIKKYPAETHEVTLLDRVKFDCGIYGLVQDGVFHYRAARSV